MACLDRDGQSAEATAAEIGNRAIARPLEVAEASVPPAVDAVARAFGRVDALINCAGITGRTNLPGLEVDLPDFDMVYRVPALEGGAAAHAVAQFGRILHVASIARNEGNAGMTAYSATKTGLIGMVKSLAKDVEQASPSTPWPPWSSARRWWKRCHKQRSIT